jgi:hypothetical protein
MRAVLGQMAGEYHLTDLSIDELNLSFEEHNQLPKSHIRSDLAQFRHPA